MKLSFLLLIVFLACQRTTEEPSKIKTITLESEISNPKKVTLSQVVSDIEYVKLEFKPECAIRYLFDVQFSKQYIFVKSDTKIFQFNRQGKYIRQVGNNGKGPGEYPNPRGFTIDESTQRVYIYANFKSSILQFDFDGNYKGDLLTTHMVSSLDMLNPKNIIIHRDMGTPLFSPGYFVVGVIKTNGDSVYIYKNAVSTDKKFSDLNKINLKGDNRRWYNGDTAMLYDVNYNDTLYKITNSNLEPEYLLDNTRKCPYNTYYNIYALEKEFMNYILPVGFLESTTSLFVSYMYKNNAYLLQYNKTNGEVSGDIQEHSREEVNTYIKSLGMAYKIENDLDGGLDIWPVQKKGNICYTVLQIGDLLKNLTPEHFATSKTKYPEKKKALEQLVKTIDPNDNPVIMIMKLK